MIGTTEIIIALSGIIIPIVLLATGITFLVTKKKDKAKLWWGLVMTLSGGILLSLVMVLLFRFIGS